MQLTRLKIQHQGWKNLFYLILLASSAGMYWCCIGVNGVWAKNSDKGDSDRQNHVELQKTSLKLSEVTQQPTEFMSVYLGMILNEVSGTATLPTAQPSPLITEALSETQQDNDPPQLEAQPRDLPKTAPAPMENLLNPSQINESEKIVRLRRRLQKQKQLNPNSNSSQELFLRIKPRRLAQQSPSESNSSQELFLRIKPRTLEQLPPARTEKPVAKFKPIGYLKANVGYFQTNNIFSANEGQIEDGLIFSGLKLASAYFPLGSKTYLNSSIDGNLIRYVDQSKYDYNQLRFNLNIYHQLSPRMYGEISGSNQQLFFAKNGDRFLNENAVRLSLGRRDPLTKKLILDSLYELSVNFADPESRSRVVNSGWVSLSYYLQKPLNVGLDYQFSFSDFTQRQREDQFHRLFGHLNYRISDYSNMNLQTGVTLGGSTVPNIDFSSWFFSVNYNLELGRF